MERPISFFKTVNDLEIQKGLRELLHPNFNLLFDVSGTRGWGAIFIDRYQKFETQTPGIRFTFDEKGFLEVADNFIKQQSLLSAKYFLCDLPLKNQDLVLVKEVLLPKEHPHKSPQVVGDRVELRAVATGKVYIYENTKVLPRAWMVYQVKNLGGKGKEEILRTLVAPEFDPKKEVVLEEKFLEELNRGGKG